MTLRGFAPHSQSFSHSIFRRPSHVLCLVSFFAGIGLAAPSAASCTKGSWSAMQPFMEAFVLDPTGILQAFPSGGDKLFFGLKDYLAADARLVLPSMIKLIRTANAAQKESIGHALGKAAYQCRHADPETSQRIEKNAKKIRDQIVLRAYSIALNDGDDEPEEPALTGIANQADWPGSGLNITRTPDKTLGADSFRLQLWDARKQNGGNILFLPQAH